MKKVKLNSLHPITGNLTDFRLWEKGWWDINTGSKTTLYNHLRLKEHLPVLPSTSYMITGLERIVFLEYNKNKEYLQITTDINKTELPHVVTTSPNTYYITAYCIKSELSGYINKVFNVNKFNFNIEEL